MAPKYPAIEVELSGSDGNSMMIIGKVGKALRRAGVPAAEIKAFRTEATSGDWEHVLDTAEAWVDVS